MPHNQAITLRPATRVLRINLGRISHEAAVLVWLGLPVRCRLSQRARDG